MLRVLIVINVLYHWTYIIRFIFLLLQHRSLFLQAQWKTQTVTRVRSSQSHLVFHCLIIADGRRSSSSSYVVGVGRRVNRLRVVVSVPLQCTRITLFRLLAMIALLGHVIVLLLVVTRERTFHITRWYNWPTTNISALGVTSRQPVANHSTVFSMRIHSWSSSCGPTVVIWRRFNRETRGIIEIVKQ